MNFDTIIDTTTLSMIVSVVIVPLINGIKYLYKQFTEKELNSKANVVISVLIPLLSAIVIYYLNGSLLAANFKEMIVTFVGIMLLSQQIYKSTNKFVQEKGS